MSTQPTIEGRIPEWTQGDLFRKARKSAGMTVSELAAATGISEKTINNYEADRVKTRRPAMIAWALATGVSLDWLERARRDSNPKPSDREPVPASAQVTTLRRRTTSYDVTGEDAA